MADYGLLTEVRVDPRTTEITVAASVSDTELVVDDAGDLDEDGGTLDLNGVQLEYTGITWGDLEDDADTVLLAEPLTVTADVGDLVGQVVAGMVAEDWYAVVDMNGGMPVPVPIRFDQRQAWPEGLYDPPVPVVVSEDLSSIEDAPGRPGSAGGRTEAWNQDEWTATGSGDAPGTLTYLPKPYSVMLEQNGIRIRNNEFSLVGQVATPLASQLVIRSGDHFTAYYDRDPGAEVVGQGANASRYIEAVQALGPIWFGVQDDTSGAVLTDYSGFGRDGTYNNGVTLGAAQIVPNLTGRTCADYDGSNDYGATPYGPWLNINGIAIVAWIHLDAVGGATITIVSRDNFAGVDPWYLYVNGSGKAAFHIGTTGPGTPYNVTGATTLLANTTYMVSGIYNSVTGSLDVFVNDALDGHAAAAGNLKSSLVYPATIGLGGASGTFANALNGRIGPVALFDPASGFSASDVASLYPIGAAA